MPVCPARLRAIAANAPEPADATHPQAAVAIGGERQEAYIRPRLGHRAEVHAAELPPRPRPFQAVEARVAGTPDAAVGCLGERMRTEVRTLRHEGNGFKFGAAGGARQKMRDSLDGGGPVIPGARLQQVRYAAGGKSVIGAIRDELGSV